MIKLEEFSQFQHPFFQKLKKEGKGPNTLKNYRTDLECFIQYLRAQKRTSIDRGLVASYGQYLQERYPFANSRRRKVQTLRLFFDYLLAQGARASNWAKEILPAPKLLRLPAPPPQAQAQALWRFLEAQHQEAKAPLQELVALRNQMIFLLIFDGGLKVSELSALKRGDLAGPRVLIVPPRRDPYSIPLGPTSEKWAKKYLQSTASLGFEELFFYANPHQILSGGLTPRGIEALFQQFNTKLSLGLTPKGLRQLGIFRWIHQGHPKSLIKEWMGVAPSYSLGPYEKNLSHYPGQDFL